MPLKVTFELDDKDLRYFRTNMKQAQSAVEKLPEAGVLAKRSFSSRTRAGRPRQMFSSPELIDLLSQIVTE